MPFWNDFRALLDHGNSRQRSSVRFENTYGDFETEARISNLADDIGRHMALTITNSGQMLFLYRITGEYNDFGDYYSLHWTEQGRPWKLCTGEQTYLFQLPKDIMKLWLDNAANELEMKKEAINCKASFLSNMIVYYTENSRPIIKMISIDKYELERARERL